ncbi:MAG TPA: glycine betaine ABC transporter substrate-binding protein [Gemmatimonadales bacterium]|nr:glycine betaine ABC transporter substrate-binding protein [Gemmatimonadales bacterium]
MRSRAAILSLAVLLGCARSRDTIVVGSKNFSESVLLGEIVAQQLERQGLKVERKPFLGGTFVCHQALVAGQLDVYVEYTGTALTAILNLPVERDPVRVRAVVDSTYRARWNLVWTESLGFENTFAILVRRRDATRLGLRTISDAVPHARRWRAVFGYEFTERADGLPGLMATYGFRFDRPPATMDLGLVYRALADGVGDITSGNSTDGQIAALDLFQLEDDRRYFPPYDAAPIVRRAVLEQFPGVGPALAALAGQLTADRMRELNRLVDVEHRPVFQVAREFLESLPR